MKHVNDQPQIINGLDWINTYLLCRAELVAKTEMKIQIDTNHRIRMVSTANLRIIKSWRLKSLLEQFKCDTWLFCVLDTC